MKRVPWILIVLAALVVGAAFFLRDKPVRPTSADEAAATSNAETVSGSFKPAAANVTIALPKPSVVEIQDGKTIDFSAGMPIVKDTDKDKAALDRALKQMEEAAAGVSFGSPKEPAPVKK